jgi:acyl-coenzyme A synthetase/AMP-(fatty) acid ligase
MDRPESRLLAGRSGQEPFLQDRSGLLDVAAFSAHAAAAARRLAGCRHVVNLCDTRLGFLAGYAGALAAGCTTLLPSSRAQEVVASVRAAFPGCQTFDDDDLQAGEPRSAAPLTTAGPRLGDDGPVMIGFTSGSTGLPTGHAKYWASVCASTYFNAERIRAAIPPELRGELPWIVGTVPSQHMYGMELTVLLPLLERMGLHGGRPLLPAEVAAALEDVPPPRVLVSTPAHLRAIVAAGARLPRVHVIISATAPLDAELARAVEAATGACLVETFGSTETCIIGHRETARDVAWRPYPGVTFTAEDGGTRVETPWFHEPQRLLDVIEAQPDGTFVLQGRSSDLIDVAGKRASLADLTQRILRIPGVVDAIAFQPESARGLVRRVAALVVAPTLTGATVRAALESAIDPVFMPRPLLFVDALPRNAAGKLPRHALEAALAAATDAGHAPAGEDSCNV